MEAPKRVDDRPVEGIVLGEPLLARRAVRGAACGAEPEVEDRLRVGGDGCHGAAPLLAAPSSESLAG